MPTCSASDDIPMKMDVTSADVQMSSLDKELGHFLS